MRNAARLLPVALAAALACAKKDPVRQTIDAVVKAANARDTASLMAHVAPGFEAADGANRAEVERRLAQYFAAYEILNVSVADVRIERGQSAARVRLTARMSGQPRKVGGLDGLLPSEARYDFELRLTEESGGWKLAWASWTPESV